MSYKSVYTLQQMRWSVAQYFERRWWKNYLSRKPSEDYIAWKKHYWHGFLAQSKVKLKPGDAVLDAGTGPAGIQMILNKQQVTAIDPLLEDYRALAHFNPDQYPWTRFERTSIEALNENDGYDHVFCLNVINHVLNLEQACDQLNKSLKAGGSLVVSIDCHKHRWIHSILKRVPIDILHPHQLTLAAYVALFENRGITITHRTRLRSGSVFDYWLICGIKR